MRHECGTLMYNYKFYIPDKSNQNGTHSIKLRYYENRNSRIQIDTGIEIQPKYWSPEKSFLKKSKEVASEFVQLTQMDSLANQIVSSYRNQGRPLSKKMFKKQFEEGEPSINSKPVQRCSKFTETATKLRIQKQHHIYHTVPESRFHRK